MTRAELLAAYLESGRVVLPIPAGLKRHPKIKKWQDPSAKSFPISEGDNLAWRLDGVRDVDLDSPTAALLAPAFLPPTPARTRRSGSSSYWTHWYYAGGGGEYRKFEDPCGGCVLEHRTGPTHYTVVPPSGLLPKGDDQNPARFEGNGDPDGPTGPQDAPGSIPAEGAGQTIAGAITEFLEWPNGSFPVPAAVDQAQLNRSELLLATATVLADALGHHGFGHDARLEVAGFLLRLGVTEDEATLIGEAISIPTANAEVDDVRVSVRSTAARLKNDDRQTKGGPSLEKRGVDPRRLRAIERWFGKDAVARIAEIEFPKGLLPLTESGDAEHFARANSSLVRFDHRRGAWLLFAGHCWGAQTDGEVDRLALKAVRERQTEAMSLSGDARGAVLKWAIGGESRARRGNLVALAESVRPLADGGENWDADPWLLGTPSGVADLRDGSLRDGRPEDRISMRTRAPYDADAACPLWDRTIADIFGSDPELIAYFDRFVGYSLTGDCREEALVVCHGDGANGKGTLMNGLAWALGDYADDLPFSTFETGSRGGIPNDVAKIAGKRFVTASETTETVRLNEARIKALTGRDPITARFLHREFFTFQPAAKFWLATNKKPIVHDDSPGFWRRIHMLPFEMSFVGRENRGLKDALREELPGILARAVRGTRLWLERGLDPPERVKAASRAWREESDPLAPFFEDACVIVENSRCGANELYSAYLEWAKRRFVKDAMSQRALGLRIRALFRVEEGRKVTYRGIGLRNARHPEGENDGS